MWDTITLEFLGFKAATEKKNDWQESCGYGNSQLHKAWDGNYGNKWIYSFRLYTFGFALKIKTKQKGMDITPNLKYQNQPDLVEN